MNYISKFAEMQIGDNALYSRDDIGVARLFHDVHCGNIRYVFEAKSWYIFTGQRWMKDDGGLRTMERCKSFVQAFAEYAHANHEDDAKFIMYADKLKSRRKREGLLRDAMSIAPASITDFDKDVMLLNVQNGTLNLKSFALQPHNAANMITKLAPMRFDPKARCSRWERFIGEVMCGDTELSAYLQKALGYSLTGLTDFEVFFILYGEKTRNGKTTLIETVSNLLGDYARNTQAQSLARRASDGAAASPDMARLKGARLVTVPEPEKGLELNIALIKQLTGGDTYTTRFLNANPFEFKPEFKLYINTNHLPKTADDTIFTSGRVKVIPFDRHFTVNEQDTRLKQYFRHGKNKSAILNWLIEGYRMLGKDGFNTPGRVDKAVEAYKSESDLIGSFLNEVTVEREGYRLPTSELYSHYTAWAKANNYRPLSKNEFVAELRRRLDVRRGGVGMVVIGIALSNPPPDENVAAA